MENLALLYWAAGETGDARYAEIATAHALTNMRHIVRPDGSSYHTFFFDPASGAPLHGATHQGFSDESCWSRGQAWAIHGYSIAYGYTGRDDFLATARRMADYVLSHLPGDGVPPWDYRLPPEAPQVRDTSAGAITAAGLFVLASHLSDSDATPYRAGAERMLAGLVNGYTTADHPHAEGLLAQGAGNVPAGIRDTMLPYGDYFYLEALLRALGHTVFFW